jgi:hypothetical protein
MSKNRPETSRWIEAEWRLCARLNASHKLTQSSRVSVRRFLGPLNRTYQSMNHRRDQFLRERCLLKARYSDINLPCVFFPDRLQIFVPENSNLQASYFTVIAREVILPRNRDRTYAWEVRNWNLRKFHHGLLGLLCTVGH